MAGTITYSITASASHSGLITSFSPTRKISTQVNQGYDSKIINVGTGAEEDFSIAADITKLGIAHFQNLDASGFVTFGPKISGIMAPFATLLPGDFALTRLATGITLRGIAGSGTQTSGSVNLWMTVYNY